MNHQTVGYALWFGVAVLGFVWAKIDVWRRERALNQIQQDYVAARGMFVQSAAAEMANSVTTP